MRRDLPTEPDAAHGGGAGETTLHPQTSTGDGGDGGVGTVSATLRAQTSMPQRDPARYEIVGEHARGGIGRILRARDRDLDRVVAVKELLASDVVAEARFKREIRLTARLEHPGIVPVHDAGHWVSDGRSFYTMKLVAGASLKDVVAGTAGLAARLALTPNVLAVAEAVAYAHSRGIIHRDLKPSNVILGDYGETIVIDWGIAKEIGTGAEGDGEEDGEPDSQRAGAADADDLTVAGAVVGTPVFMAPEQARGERVDERADVYALGALAYFVLTGKAPYHGTGTSVLRVLAAEPPTPLRALEPRVPRDLAAIVEKAMARDPADRYQSAGALASDLRRYQAGLLVLAREYSVGERASRWLRKHRLAAALTAGFVVLATVGIVVAIRREQNLRHVAERERGRAELQTRSLLEQQGRHELDAGRPYRAAVYLAEALRRDPDSRALRWLLSQALRPTEAHLRTLVGHSRDIVAVAFSPDGHRLVSGSTDTTVRLWDTATGAEQQVLRGHDGGIEDVAWSPDGALVASGDNSKRTKVWRVADGALLYTFEGSIFRLAFSADSKQLWMGGFNGDLRVHELAGGTQVLSAKPYGDRVSAISFDPARPRAVTASWDGQITVWDLATLTAVRTLDDHHAPIRFVQFRNDGALVLTGDEDGAIDVRDGDALAVRHIMRLPSSSHATSGWFGADPRMIITVSADSSVRLWHATSGQVLTTIDAVPEGKMFDGALSHDGRLLATASLHAIDLWRPDAAVDFRIFGGGEYTATDLDPGALSADGRRLVAIRMRRDGSRAIQVWDTASGEVVGSWEEPGRPQSVAVSRDGSVVAIADLAARTVRVRDGSSGALLTTLEGYSRAPYNVAISPDDRFLATAAYDNSARVWRLPAKAGDPAEVVSVIATVEAATAVAFDPSGSSRLAIAVENGSVLLADRDRGTVLRSFAAHPTWIEDVEFSPDGRHLVTAGRQDHTAKIWDLIGDAPPVVLTGHADNLVRASFSPDGALVATCSVDDTARLWDATTGELLRTLAGASATAAFAPDGATLYGHGVRDYAVAWRLTVDERSPAELAAAVAASSPWRLVDGRLEMVAPPVAPPAQ